MASRKLKEPEWREGDECVLHGKISKVIDLDGVERLAVFVEGFSYRSRSGRSTSTGRLGRINGFAL